MKNTISEKYIVDYITKNYGQLNHCSKKLTFAVRETAKVYKLNKVDLFHYIIERKNTIQFATSYGFDTAFGREIRHTFEYNYHNN
jgi:phosphotransferase system IIB component